MKTLDEAREQKALKAIAARREKLAAEMRQLVADAEHWNRTHPDKEPIVVDQDISKDVEARLRALNGQKPQ